MLPALAWPRSMALQRVVPGEFQHPGVMVLFAFAALACLLSSPWVSSVPRTFMDAALGQAR